MTQAAIQGTITIVKFFQSTGTANHPATLMTRTMGKFGVVDREYKNDTNYPADGEFWKVKIVREARPNSNTGCFILEPICKMNVDELIKLVPGLYTEDPIGNILLIRPKNKGNWIFPLNEIKKDKLRKYYALVVLNE